MPQFDQSIQYSQRLPGVTQMPRANTNVDTGARMIGQALSNLGGAVQGIGEIVHKKSIEEQRLKAYSESENGKIAVMEYDSQTESELRAMNDPEQISKYSQERLSKRGELVGQFATMPESTAELDRYIRRTAVGQFQMADEYRFKKQQDQAFVAFDKSYNEIARKGAFGVLAKKSEEAFNNGVITDKDYANRLAEIPKLQHEWNVDNIRTMSQAAVSPTGDKKDAYGIIQRAQDEGLISAEDNKVLGDSLDNFVAGRFKKDQQAKYTATMDAYKEFTGYMQQGGMTYEAVGNSSMSNDDKEKWNGYIRNQFAEPPKSSALEGYKGSIDTVMALTMMEISEQEAYDELLTKRYIDKSITDNDFSWAVEKIKNPYPKHLVPQIKSVLKDTEKQIAGMWHNKASKQRTQKTASALLLWVDNELKNGREPTVDDMNAKRKAIQNGVATMYMIGEVRVIDGKEWVVVGYNKEGGELYESVR